MFRKICYFEKICDRCGRVEREEIPNDTEEKMENDALCVMVDGEEKLSYQCLCDTCIQRLNNMLSQFNVVKTASKKPHKRLRKVRSRKNKETGEVEIIVHKKENGKAVQNTPSVK